MGVLTALAKTPMSSGNWCVSMASIAVKEQRPAVKRMKKGSSFFGYTDTSWKAGAPVGEKKHKNKPKTGDQSRRNGWVQSVGRCVRYSQGRSSLSAVSVHPG